MRPLHACLWLAGMILAISVGMATADARQFKEVDLQLVLAADVSGSMTPDELHLQRLGYVAAFRDPELLRAISSGLLGRIAVTYVEWSGANEQSVVVPWTILGHRGDAESFANRLAAAPSTAHASRTAIGSGLLFAAHLFDASGIVSARKVIDVSGDGVSNQGPQVTSTRDQVVSREITINGLSIARQDGMHSRDWSDLHAYYGESVIGGPGAFALGINGFRDFANALQRKLALEIAGVPFKNVAGTTIAQLNLASARDRQHP